MDASELRQLTEHVDAQLKRLENFAQSRLGLTMAQIEQLKSIHRARRDAADNTAKQIPPGLLQMADEPAPTKPESGSSPGYLSGIQNAISQFVNNIMSAMNAMTGNSAATTAN